MLLLLKVPIEDFDNILENLQTEWKRRLSLAAESLNRRLKIQQSYTQLHPKVYVLQVLVCSFLLQISSLLCVYIGVCTYMYMFCFVMCAYECI